MGKATKPSRLSAIGLSILEIDIWNRTKLYDNVSRSDHVFIKEDTDQGVGTGSAGTTRLVIV